MPIIVNRRGILGDIEAEAARLESLTEDIVRLAGGDRPSDRNISQAPLIDGWVVATRKVPVLVGTMHGHRARLISRYPRPWM